MDDLWLLVIAWVSLAILYGVLSTVNVWENGKQVQGSKKYTIVVTHFKRRK